MFRKLVAGLILFVGLAIVTTISASAYIDPTTTTFLVQAIAGVVAVVGSAAVLFWRRIRKRVMRLLGIDENRNKYREEDFALLIPDGEQENTAVGAPEVEREVTASVPDEPEMPKPKYWKRFLIAYIPSAFLWLTVLFLSPAEIYLGNFNDFYFPFWVMLLFLIPSSLLLAGIFSCIIAALPYRARRITSTVVFSLGLCCYTQALFFNGHMESMTGDESISHYPVISVVVNLLLWILLIGAGVFIAVWTEKKRKFRNVGKLMIFACFLLIFMQTIGVTSKAVTTADERHLATYHAITNDGQFELSENRNVVVFILDTASGDYIDAAKEKYPDLFEQLEGFTYYPDMSSTYSRTYPSIPYLLTREHCNFDIPYTKYVNDSFEKSNFLSGMSENGCNVGLYTENGLIGSAVLPLLCNYTEDAKISYSPFFLGVQMLRVSMYRDAPYLLKSSLRYDVDDVNNHATNSSGKHDDSGYEVDFYNGLKKNGITVINDASAFRFFHFNGPHPGSFLRSDGTMGIVPSAPADAVKGDITIINRYLEEMKKAGVYDNTTVIITADHGHSKISKTKGKLYAEIQASLLLLVKPAGAEHNPCVTSLAPVCQEDLFATVYDGLGLDGSAYGQTVYEIPEGVARERTYYNSALFSDMDGEIVLLEYQIVGDSRKPENYHYTGKYKDILYSTRAVSKKKFKKEMMEKPDKRE